MTEPIRIYVGTEPKTEVPLKVLEYSIKSRTSAVIDFIPMRDKEPWLVPKNVHQATLFSLRRLMIPEVCEYKGRAIYLDADQIVLADIQQLWDYGDNGKVATCCWRKDKCSNLLAYSANEPVPQTSVMVINCDMCNELNWNKEVIFNQIRKGGLPHSNIAVKRYQKIMHIVFAGWEHLGVLPEYWNEFNACPVGTKLVHFTFETDQPWYKPKHALCSLWEAELKKAIEAGFVTEDVFRDSLARWHKGSGDWRAYGGMNPYWEKMLPLFEGTK